MRAITRALPALLGATALIGSAVIAATVSGASTAPAADAPAVPIVQATPTKIMPIGDSNTPAATPRERRTGWICTNCSRPTTADRLRRLGHVGSDHAQQPQPRGARRLDHRPDPGWCDRLAEHLHAGRDHAPDRHQRHVRRRFAGAAPGKLSALIDSITTTLPNVKVFVSAIPVLQDVNHHARVAAFNYTIPGIVAAKVAAGEQVSYLDANSGLFQPFDFVDMWHPNYGGASKSAVPLVQRADRGADDPLRGRADRERRDQRGPDRDQITSASGGAKVGYIDLPDSFVKFTFQVGTAGAYRIRARGANGMGTECTRNVSANGGTAVAIECR